MSQPLKEHEIRRGVDGLARNLKQQADREGSRMTGEQAREQAAKVAERADKERNNGR
jgi:hypothetical protein